MKNVFKVGDKVRVRKDLVVDRRYDDGCIFVDDMAQYKGLEFEVTTTKYTDRYKLEGIHWYFSPSMLEPVIESKSEPKFKVGDKVKVVKNEDCYFGWIEDMDTFVGKVCTIKSIIGKQSNTPVEYILEEDYSYLSWSFDEDCFELVNRNQDYTFQLGDRVFIEGCEERLVVETNEGYNFVRFEVYDLAWNIDAKDLEELTDETLSVWEGHEIKVITTGGEIIWLSK